MLRLDEDEDDVMLMLMMLMMRMRNEVVDEDDGTEDDRNDDG